MRLIGQLGKITKDQYITFHGSMCKALLCNFLLIIVMGLSLTGCSSTEDIVHNLTEREANDIIVLLASYNIDATKTTSSSAAGGPGSKVQQYNIEVPADKALRAMSILNDNGLPRIHSPNLLDIFGQSGLVPSDVQEKIRYQAGLAQQIASTIRNFDGVYDASVILAIPTPNPLNPQQQGPPPTAAVFVKNNGVLESPNSNLRSKIKRLVAAAVPGLTYDNVTVVGDEVVKAALPITPVNPTQKLESIWGVKLTEGAVNRFRLILYSEIFLNIVLLIMAILLILKIRPLMKSAGLKELISMHQFEAKPHKVEPPSKSEAKPQSPEVPADKREREDV